VLQQPQDPGFVFQLFESVIRLRKAEHEFLVDDNDVVQQALLIQSQRFARESTRVNPNLRCDLTNALFITDKFICFAHDVRNYDMVNWKLREAGHTDGVMVTEGSGGTI